MTTKQIIVSGKVQGVGFRNYAHRMAAEMKIIGWARNLRSGQVEIIAQSEDGLALESFIKKIQKGPERSKVDHLEINVIDIIQIQNDVFTIQPDGEKKSEF